MGGLLEFMDKGDCGFEAVPRGRQCPERQDRGGCASAEIFSTTVIEHLRLVVVDVVGKEDLPALVFEGDADQANAREEFGGSESAAVAVAIRWGDRQAVAAAVESLQGQVVARLGA